MATVHYLFDDESEVTADQPLDLTPYPTLEELNAPAAPRAFEGLRRAEGRFSRIMIIVSLAMLSWMLIGVFCAHMAGRL